MITVSKKFFVTDEKGNRKESEAQIKNVPREYYERYLMNDQRYTVKSEAKEKPEKGKSEAKENE